MARPLAGVVSEKVSADARKRVGDKATFVKGRLVEPERLIRPFEGISEEITLVVSNVVEIRPSDDPQAGEMAAGSPPVRHYEFEGYPGFILEEKDILA